MLAFALLGAAPAFAQSLAVPIPAVNDPRLANLTIPATAPTLGMWSASFSWPLVGLHVAILPDGQVVTFGTPVGQGVQDGRTIDRWDPLTATVTAGHTTVGNSVNVDSFCGAGILQTGGQLLVAGGDSGASSGDFSRNSMVFDPGTNTPTTQPSVMASDRWYATLIKLADGRSIILGGGNPYVTTAYQNPDSNLGVVSMTPEVWTPGTGWSSLFGANSRDAFGPDFNRWWYPRAWVVPSGKVFGISVEKLWLLDPAGAGSMTTVGNFKTGYDETTRPNVGPTSTAAMYDVGKILQVGGNGPANQYASTSSNLATAFDVTGATPIVTETAPMTYGRQWANMTVLPNGRVLVTGGTRYADNGDPDAVYQAEQWDPATGTWQLLSSAAIIRNYHSATSLLPDGIVLSTGGGVPGPVTNLNAELYYPPYLFATVNGVAQLADRPRMVSASANEFGYGRPFQIEMADARTISKVVLIGLSATTHSFNMGQRRIPLTFSQSGAMLTITAPASTGVAPPGYYQAIALDGAGVPSRGFIMQTDATVAALPMDQTTGTVATDTSGNGKNGTLNGGATWVAGHEGNAVALSGGNQYVSLPAGIVAACSDFTFASWVNLTANGNWNRIFDFGSGTNTNMFLTPRANGAVLRFAIKNNGGAEQQLSYNVDMTLGTWHHVAVVLSNTTGQLFLDGVQVATATIALNPINLGATANNWLGRSQYTADPYYNGKLDDVRISCRAFSAQEVAVLAGRDPLALYAMDQTSGTTVKDTSGNGFGGTLVGGATWTTAGHSGSAVSMSGANQYVALPPGLVQTCGDFTFAGWVNLTANPNWNRIFDFGSGTNTNMFLTPRANGAVLRFAIRNNGGAEQQISYNVDLGLNAWHHVGVVLNGNLGTLYLDGTAVATNPNITLDPVNLGLTTNDWLGRSQYADPYLNGKLDDVRVSCRAYSASEMATLAH
ncbi:MAG: LamG-like jellyroll fold domain-containing protein [Verrucomicrobiota bacterium]